MAWTMWAFQFKGDSWSRVPWKWYERFTAGKTAVEEPEGTILRFALVSVELEDREPERAQYPSFVVHKVAGEGLINKDREAQARLAAAEMTFDGLLSRVKDGAGFLRKLTERLHELVQREDFQETWNRISDDTTPAAGQPRKGVGGSPRKRARSEF